MRAGINKQQSWAAGVMGVSNRDLDRMRRLAAGTVTASKTGSLDVKLHTAGLVGTAGLL